MKKNLIISCGMLLFCLLLFYGCRKEAADDLHQKKCRLTNVVWGDGSTWHFHYNDKGLADKWILDFGDGLPHDFTLKYDIHNRLIKAFDHYNNTVYTYIFTYSGSRLIKQVWSNNTTPDGGEIVNTYDNRGNMVRRDDKVNDIHVVFKHNRIGNSPHFDFYLGKELYITGDFTFNIPNKNPLLTVNGLDVGFFYYSYGLWDKWWETSDRYVLYDNSNPVVLLDYDPSKTVFHFGKQHYLSSVNYFDKVSQTDEINILSYENCPGECDLTNAQSLQNSTTVKKSRSLRSLLLISNSAASVKQRIKELRTDRGVK